MKAVIGTLIGITVILYLFVGMVQTRKLEMKAYNNGICPVCGGKYICDSGDSQGGRRYRCDKCGNFIWITYNVDKPRKDV